MDFKKNPRTDFKDVTKLNQEPARQEIDALREGIEYHDYLYYVKDQPAISDETYDKLLRRLQELEQAFPEFASADSPTHRVAGRPAARLEKVRHTALMLSLNAAYQEKEVEDFVRMVRREARSQRIAYTAEPKFDGLSVERDALDIEGLGHKTVQELVGREMVKSIADLYRLSVEDLKQVEGFAEKSARQLYEAIQRARKARLDRFLYALGIHRVGQHAVQAEVRHFGSMEALENAGLRDLEAVAQIGSVTAQSLYNFFHQDQTRKGLHQLYAVGVEVEPMLSRRREGPLEGRRFVFTGELEQYTRQEAQRLVEQRGGSVASTVSDDVDYVVVGRDPGRKFDVARRKNIKTINEKTFQKLIGAPTRAKARVGSVRS